MSNWTTQYEVQPASDDSGEFFCITRQVLQVGPKERLDYRYYTMKQASAFVKQLIANVEKHSYTRWLLLGEPIVKQAVEDSGSHCEYYHVAVLDPENPNQMGVSYEANCEDIIQALGMTFDEGCEFKTLWRRARARQGYVKAESTPTRDAVKAVHYAGRVLRYEQRKEAGGIILTVTAEPDPHWQSHPATGCSSCHGSGLNQHGHKCFCRGTN